MDLCNGNIKQACYIVVYISKYQACLNVVYHIEVKQCHIVVHLLKVSMNGVYKSNTKNNTHMLARIPYYGFHIWFRPVT